MLVSEAFCVYRQAEIVAAGLSKKTFESYFYAEKLAVSFFSDVEVSAICAEDVRDFYAHLLTWQKPDTARGNIVCLRAVLRYAGRKGEKVMDIEDIKVPKREKRAIQYLTEAEVRAFIEVVGKSRRGYAKSNRIRNVAIVELLYATGLRVGELCRLNRNTIRNRQFTVVGKSKEPRVCFISTRVEQILADYLKVRTDKNPALFVSKAGGRITTHGVREVFQNTCANSDFTGVTPHTIRHSFATFLLEKEVDLRYIGDLMGHQSLDTTKMYTHFANPKLRKIYENAVEN